LNRRRISGLKNKEDLVTDICQNGKELCIAKWELTDAEA
jgi:hypothetical protein